MREILMSVFHSVFDIIGPSMIGPSSSHTAGAVKIGKAAKHLFNGSVQHARIYLYGSFAKTYKGHGTDRALIAGILGFETDDVRIIDALALAKEVGLNYEFIEAHTAVEEPNTVRIELINQTQSFELLGVSLGGGKVEIREINGFALHLSGNHPAICVLHNDRFGAIAAVTKILAKYEINIGRMEVNRRDVGKEALMTIELDQNIDQEVEQELSAQAHIVNVAKIVE